MMMPAASSAAFSLSFVWVFICEPSRSHIALYASSPPAQVFLHFGVNVAKWPKSVASRGFVGQSDPMPSLDKFTPEVSPKSLSMREARTGTILSVARATLPAQMVLRLRRVAGDLGDLAQDPSAPAPDRISAAKAMVTVQDQLIDLLSLPKRPAAAGKGKPTAPMLDVSPTHPDLS